VTLPEIAEVCRKSSDVIETLMYQNTKFLKLIEGINQRDDIPDSVREYIRDILEGRGKEKLN